MRLKTIHAAVAGALMLGGASAVLAQQYYVIQPVASEGVVVQERIVTQPAQPVVAVPGERMTVTYNVDSPYPFPSPETHVTQTGVFVPDNPRVIESAPGRIVEPAPRRTFRSEPVITD